MQRRDLYVVSPGGAHQWRGLARYHLRLMSGVEATEGCKGVYFHEWPRGPRRQHLPVLRGPKLGYGAWSYPCSPCPPSLCLPSRYKRCRRPSPVAAWLCLTLPDPLLDPQPSSLPTMSSGIDESRHDVADLDTKVGGRDEFTEKGNYHSEVLVDQNLMNDAFEGENAEHAMGVWEAVKTHPSACFWAFTMCFTIVRRDASRAQITDHRLIRNRSWSRSTCS